jgi:hypothetical protein
VIPDIAIATPLLLIGNQDTVLAQALERASESGNRSTQPQPRSGQ